MSVPVADPQRTHALLVGIERYAGGWPLDGPSRDVADLHGWLRGHGVPAAQIHVEVAPLPENAARVQALDANAGPATGASVHAALMTLRAAAGDMLVLFWAGHGAISDGAHRLFVADATAAVKRNFAWGDLRESLASSFFAGFARQLLIVDACADRRNDFEFSTPGEALPVGQPRAPGQLAQFTFFATSPGEPAKNLGGTERRGLFSRELLRELQEADPAALRWPPDLDTVARRVQEAFRALRAAGQATQAPRFEWRDWDGDLHEVHAPAPPRTPRADDRPAVLTLQQLGPLVDALLRCTCMRNEAARDDLLGELDRTIADRVPRRADARSDVTAIVRTACAYPGGLERLLQVVGYLEGDSLAWREIERIARTTLAPLGLVLREG